MRIKFDINGNRTLLLGRDDLGGARGFSIQTLGNLPQTHQNGIGPYTLEEVMAYLKRFGTTRQKQIYGIA